MRLLSEKEYKEKIVNVLFEIDDICRENKLSYMIYYGTLLGSVRNGGMIPWDDDIDIVMPRKDYESLSSIIKDGNYPINFIDINTSKDTIFPHGKICDKTTTVVENNFQNVKNYGAFVDVFPLDYAPNNAFVRRIEKSFLKTLVIIETHAARTGFDMSESVRTNVLRYLAFYSTRLLNPQVILKLLNWYVLLYKKPTAYYRIFGGDVFPVSMLKESSEVEFEGRMVIAPKNPEAVLTQCFGSDFMIPPPIEQRKHKHSIKCFSN